MKKIQKYDNDSISQLKGADRVRLRPTVIFGSDDIVGCQQGVFEILSNSIDEFRAGFGKEIVVSLHTDYSITIEDFGRGIPVDYNNIEKKYNWELLFCELYAGGKFDDEDSYSFSLGLNGLGLCATQYASRLMDVRIFRDGEKYTLHFEKGENVGGLHKESYTYEKTGSKITWLPDLDVFTDIDIDSSYFLDVLEKQAIVNAGLRIIFHDEINETEHIFFYEEGIRDYMRHLKSEKSLTDMVYLTHQDKGRDREDKPAYDFHYELVFCFDNEKANVSYYHNSSFLEYGGSPDRGVKSAFVYAVDQVIKEQDMYRKNEKRITWGDVFDSLLLISSGFSSVTSYENQTKRSINNRFIQDSMNQSLRAQLEVFFIENPMDGERVANQVLANMRSREHAEKTRLAVRKQLTGGMDFTNRVKKFVDCRTKDKNKREIYIVEGDSALGSCVTARDPLFQGIIPIRGKILNCLKANYDRIFASEVIVDLLKVLGCGVELEGKQSRELSTFDLDKLNWSKVIICTDGDVDGFQIRTLILAMLYRLVPTLIYEKKVFIAETPLYEIIEKKNTYFAYSDQEKDSIVRKLKNPRIQRSKGLGENEPEMLWETTMNPATRKLVQVLPEDGAEMAYIFDLLLGNNLQGRKDYIEENGHKYIDLTETV